MKKEIRCPQCGTTIQLDEATQESILEQVKKEAIEEAVRIRSREIEARYDAKIETEKESARLECMSAINEVNTEYRHLQEKHQRLLTESARMYQNEERRINELQNELNINASRQEAAIEAAVSAEREKSSAKDMQIIHLQEALRAKDMEMNTTSQNIMLSSQNEINQLKNEINNLKASAVIEMNAQREAHKAAIQAKDEEIAHYRDFRSRQSVKLLGESLEEHCRMEYESVRSLLPNATFEKDTKVSESGSMGDFIFRETDTTGAPLISVMYEMKTEEEDSKYKHKNEDFLKELDKDRREKECEYAVLVSTLEPENDHYNRGIVDVSHKYPKMFVIRPQFFLPLLILLRTVAEDKTSLRKRIIELESEQITTSSLEEDLCDFKSAVLRCHALASSNRDRAIKHLDSAIKLLEETKEDLIKMDKHLDVAKNKAEKVTIQKLAKEYPTVFVDSVTTETEQIEEAIPEMTASSSMETDTPGLYETISEIRKPA